MQAQDSSTKKNPLPIEYEWTTKPTDLNGHLRSSLNTVLNRQTRLTEEEIRPGAPTAGAATNIRRQTGEQQDRQVDRQTDRQAGREVGRQTGKQGAGREAGRR